MWLQEHRDASIKSKRTASINRLKSGELQSNHAIKRALFLSGRKDECEICGVSEWRGIKLNLDLDHIDGDSFNNLESNLRLLCPNCHSITDTYKGRNKNAGKKKVSDEELLLSLRESANVRQALIKVGLAPKGGNYTRALKLLNKPA